MIDPRDIYQEMLDLSSKAFWAEEYEADCARMAYPGFIRTRDAILSYTTASALLPSLRSMRNRFSDQGATAFLRICDWAHYVTGDPERITGAHMSYVLSGSTYVIPPYKVRMALVLKDGLWKVAGMLSDIPNALCAAINTQSANARLGDTAFAGKDAP